MHARNVVILFRLSVQSASPGHVIYDAKLLRFLGHEIHVVIAQASLIAQQAETIYSHFPSYFFPSFSLTPHLTCPRS